MERREFFKFALALAPWFRGSMRKVAGAWEVHAVGASAHPLGLFPVTVQLSPLPGEPLWKKSAKHPGLKVLQDILNNALEHGFTGLEYPFALPLEHSRQILAYAQARGMYITCNRSFNKHHDVEGFGRNAPPPISVYSPRYAPEVRKNVEAIFAGVSDVQRLRNLFPYHDEPFHAGPESFDYGPEVQAEFKKLYGYNLPPDLKAARKSPKVWQDVINFRSGEFPAGWRQAYKIIKETDPDVRVVLTHDSHTTFGGGVRSNAKLAVDDVFHWGGDFADTFVFDIYPYMMFDFRYGACGKLPKPRLSQLHYAFGHMRNLVYTYGKELGFWFGTFNTRWFSRFMDATLRAEYWAERETTFTALAQGANFLISGYLIPQDAKHWESLGEGLRVIQKAGPALRRAPKAQAKACFFFPRTQYIQLQEEYWNVGLSYELFLRAFGELDVLHEDQVSDDRLKGYSILTLFDVRLLPTAVARHIESFVRAGGVVIADCVPNLNESVKPLHSMEQVFGVRNAATGRVPRSGVWVPSLERAHWMVPPLPGEESPAITRGEVVGKAFGQEFHFKIVSPRPCEATAGEVLLRNGRGQPALVRQRLGKGQAFLLGFCVQDTYFQTWQDADPASRSELRNLLFATTKAAGIRARVRSSNPEIEAALRIHGREAFLVLINHQAASPSTKVRLTDLEFKLGEIADVDDNKKLHFTRAGEAVLLDLTVAHDRPRLLRLTPA